MPVLTYTAVDCRCRQVRLLRPCAKVITGCAEAQSHSTCRVACHRAASGSYTFNALSLQSTVYEYPYWLTGVIVFAVTSELSGCSASLHLWHRPRILPCLCLICHLHHIPGTDFRQNFKNHGLANSDPRGQIWPPSSVNPARGSVSVLTLNPARVLPPNAPKDERLFSCRAGLRDLL